MIEKQVITKVIEIDDEQWIVAITRQFAVNALVRRRISEADFYRFIEQYMCTIELLARRKIKLLGLADKKVTLERDDLTNPVVLSSARISAPL